MAPLQDQEPIVAQREGLPPGFRMRADAHYVDMLDSSSRPAETTQTNKRTAQSSPAPASVSQPVTATARLLDAFIDDALRGITAATTLNAASAPAVRSAASDVIAVESQRALRLLTAARVLRGEYPWHRAPVKVHGTFTRLAQLAQQEHALVHIPLKVSVIVDEEIAVQGSEDLLLTAGYAIITALGTAVPSSSARRLEIAAESERDDTLASVTITEHGLSVPDQWIHTAFEQPWPVASGGATVPLLTAARRIAEWHSGSLDIRTRHNFTSVHLKLPLATAD